MFSEFKEKIVRRLAAKQAVKPLVSSQSDVKLLKQVKGKRFPGLRQLGHISKILSVKEKRIVLISFLFMMAGALLFGYGNFINQSKKVPAVGGKYTEAVKGSPQLINPIFATLNDVDVDLSRLIFSGLMKYDKDQKLVPDLAESYELSPDQKTYTFKLRKDVKWHNGTQFTSKDVAYTFDTIQDKSVGSPLFVSFVGITIEVIDDFTIKFQLAEPFTPFLSSLTVGIISESVWFDVSPDRIRLHKMNMEPIGTGSFMFKRLTKNESGYIHTYELERFADYFGDKPYISEFVFKFFGDYDGPDGSIQALRGQRVDGINFIPHDLRDRVERKHIDLHTLQLPQYTALFFNQQANIALKDSKIRVALENAIDKDRILRGAIKGEGQIVHSPILPGYPGYNPEINKAVYDTAAANTVLDEKWPRITAEEYKEMRRQTLLKEVASFETASSTEMDLIDVTVSSTTGVSTTTERESLEKQINEKIAEEINEAQIFYRKSKEGVVLEINLVTANTPEYHNAAELIAGLWQEVGVKTNIEYIDTKEFSRIALKDRKYDVLLYGVIVGSNPDQYPYWHSTQISYPGLNLSMYVNRNVDALLEKARVTTNADELVELYKKFQDLIISEHPAIYLYMPTYTYVTSNVVKGFDVVRIFDPSDRFANVNEWYIKTKINWK